MRIAKWRNSLAVHLPAALVPELDLKAGDDIDLRWDSDHLLICRSRSADRTISELRRFRGSFHGAPLSRDEANEQ